jgi:predicted SprT family Zn-dependent metalloprotease
VRLRVDITISVLALMTIIWGVRFAVAQEHRRTPEFLEGRYRELNRTFFDNSLPPVRIEWADLTDVDVMGRTFQESDDLFVIQVDRNTNFGHDDLQDTVEHETCHVATWRKQEDPHGPLFQACMARIKANEH